ncbi:hypothetical protein T265_01222 [Opisthorchis viverrini]|uniref:Peptidase, T1 family n=1 Tax=Opisthorchis viverrini TaxID=6198 RepID=A0A075A3B3_OPIVI|nr:hypothetical protein T265_01222 [Opisthorchis viverrini]KER32732.1 hypothetical protein T265_01222 [Opisthorchis viverrini]
MYMHAHTLYSAIRPFGVSLLLGSCEEDGPHLYVVEPSGLSFAYRGCAIGKAKQNATTEIEKLKPMELSSNDLVKEAAKMFRLRTSGDAEAAAAAYAGVGSVLSEQAEASLLDWILVFSRLCAVRLAKSVRESRESEVHRTLFVVSAYAPTDCSPESAKDRLKAQISLWLLVM